MSDSPPKAGIEITSDKSLYRNQKDRNARSSSGPVTDAGSGIALAQRSLARGLERLRQSCKNSNFNSAQNVGSPGAYRTRR